ncbi:unnamed protein product, partial [Cuscuta europaea]
MRGMGDSVTQHQAFAAPAPAASTQQSHPQQQYSGRGGAPPIGGRGGRGQRGQRGHRGRGRVYGYPGTPGHQLYPRGYELHYMGPHASFPSGASSAVDHTYASPPPLVICQLCFTPGHSAITCSKLHSASTPALAALP